jgi:hypothetical protein
LSAHGADYGRPFQGQPAAPLYWAAPRSEATLDFSILTVSSVAVRLLLFSHGSSFQLNSVSIVNQPVHNGIGDGRVSDMVVPVLNGELTGDQGGTRSVAIFDDFKQIPSFRVRERG